MSTDKTEFDNKIVDKTAAIARMGCSAIPFVGGVLSEIVNAIIPGQRIDRISDFLKTLQERLPPGLLDNLSSVPQKLELLEESLYAVGLTPQKERRSRITSLTLHGLTKTELDADHHSRMLQLLQLLSDTDIVVLQFFAIQKANLTHEQKLKSLTEFAQRNSGLLLIKNQFDQNEKSEKEGKLVSHASYLNSLALLQPLKLQNYVRNIDGRNARDEHRFAYDIARAINEALHVAAEKRFEISKLGLELLEALDAHPISKAEGQAA